VNLLAPAKINLSLRILRKRPDQFHEIESVMLPISLCDELTLTLTSPESGLQLTCSDPSLPTDDSNLVYRAARLFFEHAGQAPAATLHLHKSIPHGAGLGGGSSDAASTLSGLNTALGRPLSAETLHAIAAALGSDVPFFLKGGAALCRGRGEQVEPYAFTEKLPLLLVKPGFSIPTPWAYQQWQGSSELPDIPYGVQKLPFGELVNDLERPVFEKHLFLAVLKRWLLRQPETLGALMSGSGSTCFAVLRDAADGPTLEARVKAAFDDPWTALCQTLTQHPPVPPTPVRA